MTENVKTLQRMYERFNAKDIDGVLAMLTDDVAWANGMDGGYVHGHDGIRAYWTRQWTLVDPHVEPLSFRQSDDNAIIVEVRQTIRDLTGKPVEVDGLKDKTVGHLFHFVDGKVSRFDIRENK
ncbi:nuclear transport factor 2 family protein [Jiella mangrovi]|uniref:Nuclear transport factor 2 family protein n=1 Tax=Jiella mangrovi TaxID=2821407 RepID=A0ABS4BPY5_9HYPH|nr:nuclear transport factor 2 family protein [Jiella mangrovi]MBP0618291.1 nuclear transport factor 2 family protein [Jiella mangrovi]